MREKTITVTTTATEILDYVRDRVEWVVQNQGTADVFLGRTKYVSASGDDLGRLLEAGEIESVNVKDLPRLVKERQYAVASSGSAVLWIWEG